MKNEIQDGLGSALILVAKNHGIDIRLLDQAIEIERCKDPENGDFASNIALKYAKVFKMKPRQLADELVVSVPLMDSVAGMEVAGPGFINIRLSRESITAVLENVVAKKERYGCFENPNARKILVEFVSANPTGPLHVGHGRGAAYGDSLSRLLIANGHQVDREYYINDFGRQMDILALSVYWRYVQECGIGVALPKGIYQGDYVIDIAKKLKEKEGKRLAYPVNEWAPDYPQTWTQEQVDNGDRDRWIDGAIAGLKEKLGQKEYRGVFDLALSMELDDIRGDLEEFGVFFDRWFSERSMSENDMINNALKKVDEAGYLYEKDGAVWFKSTAFGDEKDRVVRRKNGMTTYFSSDISYHFDKYNRGYDQMIDILGADHHGYMARVRASLAALGLDPEKLEIALVQFAVLYKGGEKMQMSTRSGEFVTLRDLREHVGADAARFFYVMRKPEQHLDFDLDLAESNSKDNPFYYVEYAHARCCGMLNKAEEEGYEFSPEKALNCRNALVEPEETALISELHRYPEVVIAAGEQMAPHQIIIYLKELATRWHHYYDVGHKVLHEDEEIRNARLLLTWAVRQVLRNALAIIGVQARERM